MPRKPYTLNSPTMRRAVLKDLRVVKGWLGTLVAVWSPSIRSSMDPATGRWDFHRPLPVAEYPEHHVETLTRTIADIDHTIAALKTIRNVTEEMLGAVLAGRDPLAAQPESVDPVEQHEGASPALAPSSTALARAPKRKVFRS